ncbi:MAG: DUF4340 domain-containing protein, partial [Pseudomonadales bacterium]|nr:DUF4340 domain-containing protein [Pseudomonadales bacterium]
MEKTVRLLAGLLVLQLLLALGLGTLGPELGEAEAGGPLLAFEADAVDRVTVADGEGARAVLARGEAGWVLPDAGAFPADGDKVERLLERLAELQATVPVATSAGARERFRVAEDAHERRIVLEGDGARLAELYLGTSQGVRQVHARAGDGDAIVPVELPTYEAPTDPDDWLDRTVLQFDAATVRALRLDGLVLRRTTADDGDGAPAWGAEGLPAGRGLAPEAVDTFVDRLAELRIGGLLAGDAADAELGLDDPVLDVELERDGTGTVRYRLGRLPEDDGYALALSTREERFRMPVYSARPILE